MRPLAAVDCETDGLHWSRQAWEIAIVRRHADGNELTKVMLLDIDLRRADPKALEIGGFYERHPRGIYLSTGRKPAYREELTSPEQAAQWVHRLTFGATLVGAQPHFDAHILARLLHAQGLQPSWHHRMVPEADQHTAAGDARMALAIYDKIVGAA